MEYLQLALLVLEIIKIVLETADTKAIQRIKRWIKKSRN